MFSASARFFAFFTLTSQMIRSSIALASASAIALPFSLISRVLAWATSNFWLDSSALSESFSFLHFSFPWFSCYLTAALCLAFASFCYVVIFIDTLIDFARFYLTSASTGWEDLTSTLVMTRLFDLKKTCFLIWLFSSRPNTACLITVSDSFWKSSNATLETFPLTLEAIFLQQFPTKSYT